MKNYCFILLLFFAFFTSCVLPFDPKLKNDNPKLVIEGLITDKEEILTVKISYTAAYSDASNFEKFASGFDVKIVDDLNNKINFGETLIKGTYHLEITTTDGNKIESLPEKLANVPKIKRIFNKFRKTNIAKTEKIHINNFPNIYIGVFDVYLESQDSPTPNEYYRIDWQHFEPRKFCSTGIQPADKISNTLERFLKFPCCNKQPCWDISYCQICPILISDKFVNGNLITDQFLGTISYYSDAPFFMLIKQYSLSERAYNFRKRLKDLTSNVGGIFDYSPFQLKGNLYSKTNQNQEILGFFEASSVDVFPTYMFRNNAPFPPSKPTLPEIEIMKFCIPCTNSIYRTSIQPEGWYDSGFFVDEE